MPSGFALVLVFPIAGRLSDRFPAGLLIGGGMAFSLIPPSDRRHRNQHGILDDRLVDGSFPHRSGLVFPALTAGSLRVLPHALVAQGSGAMNFVRQLGGAFGVNLLAIFLERQTMFHADALTATQTSDNL